jgi:nucleoside-diphosphate-sugar epimerase
MATALLTGASGFTGQVMRHALVQRGMHVVTLDCDITHQDAVRAAVIQAAPDWVIHLAALSFVGDTDLEAFYRVNVLGTLHLLEALDALKRPPSRVLIASSANIYGTPSLDYIDEQVIPAPVNHYACSKLVMEHLVNPWLLRLPMVITRPFNYTGVGQDDRFLIPKIVGHYARRAPVIELGNLEISRDFSDVRDVVSAYLALLDSTACGVKVNVCSGRATSLLSIVEQMNTIAGYAIEVQVNPQFVRANEIRELRGDNRRLHHLVGQVPSIPIEQTLADMFAARSA